MSIDINYEVSKGQKIIINCNYREMSKMTTIYADTYETISEANFQIDLQNGGFFLFRFINGNPKYNVVKSKFNNEVKLNQISETEYEIEILKDVKNFNAKLIFEGEKEPTLKHAVELCKKCDISIEIK